MDIKVDYNGAFPNLCSGHLNITIDGKVWSFGAHCLCSGGSVWFNPGWREHVTSGEWSINAWPEGFPEELKEAALEAVNDTIEFGCCGGCV